MFPFRFRTSSFDVIFAVYLNGIQISSLLSVDITDDILFTALEDILVTPNEVALSNFFVRSPPNTPKYDALLHIHLQDGLKRIDVEPFQNVLMEAVASANDGMSPNMALALFFRSTASASNINPIYIFLFARSGSFYNSCQTRRCFYSRQHQVCSDLS